MPGFCTPSQVKEIVMKLLRDEGYGGHKTGEVVSISPLKIKLNSKIVITKESLYVTDSVIGLKLNVPGSGTATLRDDLKVGDGVLLLPQPRADGKQMYVLLDRIQQYNPSREVSV